MTITNAEVSPHIGLEISGMTSTDLVNQPAADDCLAALEQHGVVIYREVNVDDADLVAFSRMLGEVVANPTGEHVLPEIATITLDPAKTDPRLAWYRKGNFLWHLDGAIDELPQRATLLTARQVDPAGGDTEFATTYAAYDALPAAEKEQIADLRVVHSFAAAQRLAHPDATAEDQAAWDAVPSRVHPLVWSRRGGRKSMLLGATAGEVVGMSADAGRELLDHLLEWSTRRQFTLRHQWRQGDLVIWDNTGMLHRARPFEATSTRLMHRTTLVGVESVHA